MSEGDVFDARRQRAGLFCAAMAYGLWGLFPLYFRQVATVAPVEVLAHRAFWSFVVLAVVLVVVRRWRDVMRTLARPRVAMMLAASSVLIAVNWLTFVYAVASGQVLQSSLGYFITPLVSVLLGFFVLKERLRIHQWLAIALAATGVVILGLSVGQWPWIASVLAVSFGSYGLMRKLVPVDSLLAISIETLLMAPLALGYMVYLGASGTATAEGTTIWGMLALAGVVTSVPLLFYGAAAQRLQLATVGMMQYLTPTLTFLLAVFVFGEPFSNVQLLSFGFIWAAVALYVFDSVASLKPPTAPKPSHKPRRARHRELVREW